jgi:nitroimidazol reductase NimA-like FMN-containing flavoprotein (pyridoxamine 5'-phosphate oxidase superfamily)
MDSNVREKSPMAKQADMQFRRLREKGSRDFALACKIIDAARTCHVGFTLNQQPYVVPMALARDGAQILLHGSVASRLMKNLAGGLPCCATVTLLDGLVLARSAFNSSMNYRCVMIFGQATEVTDIDDKIRGLELLTRHLMPGRLDELRPSTRKELNATMLLSLPLTSFTVKVSDSPPDDPAKDLHAPVWAGVLPLRMKACRPQPAPDLADSIPRRPI